MQLGSHDLSRWAHLDNAAIFEEEEAIKVLQARLLRLRHHDARPQIAEPTRRIATIDPGAIRNVRPPFLSSACCQVSDPASLNPRPTWHGPGASFERRVWSKECSQDTHWRCADLQILILCQSMWKHDYPLRAGVGKCELHFSESKMRVLRFP